MNEQRPHGSTPGPQAPGPQNGPQGGYGPPQQGPNGYGPQGGYQQNPYQQQWQQQPPPKKNWFLRHKFLTALLALAVIIGISVAAGGGSKKGGTDAGSSATASGGAKKSGGSSQDAKDAAPVAIGTPVRDGKFEFTVTKVERGRKSVGQQYMQQTAQGEYTVVHVTVKNIGDQQQSLSDSDQKAMDAAGTQYAADSSADMSLMNNQVLFEQINPGNQINGVLAFDAPVGKKLTKIEFHDSMFSGGVTASL